MMALQENKNTAVCNDLSSVTLTELWCAQTFWSIILDVSVRVIWMRLTFKLADCVK